MKLTIPQPSLSKAVQVASRAVSQRSTLAILSHLLLEAEGDTLRISGTSLSMRTDCTVSCTGDKSGSLTVSAKLFGDIVSKLSGSIALEVNHKTKSLDIACGNYKARINGLDAGDFPAKPEDEQLASVTINGDALCQMIAQTTFAASTDMSRLALTGIEVVFEAERLTLGATDGYRLARRAGKLAEGINAPQTVIVPAVTLYEIATALASVGDEPTAVNLYANRISFHANGLHISAQLLDAKFPDYHAIIPKSHDTAVTVDAKAFVRALQVARILTRQGADGTERVDLCVEPGKLHISVGNAEVGDSGDVLEAEVTGKEAEMTISIGYLLDVLTRVEGKVEMRFNGANRPLVIQLPDVDAQEYIQVIMPMGKGRD